MTATQIFNFITFIWQSVLNTKSIIFVDCLQTEFSDRLEFTQKYIFTWHEKVSFLELNAFKRRL